ncbi:hypothetical protein [Flavobacterium sp. N2038]|uniref:hypothetical protein n=1 Tax=Flavobacterium sp. N2038 TaxID=2986829 RepID=UPI0022256B02|nr:hypothetical protein [Flavobacterium sp. N2038]
MNTTDKRNSIYNSDQRHQNTSDRNTVMNEELYDLDDIKTTDNDNAEIANRGYTIRNGHNPDKPNPDEEEDLNDDFHNQRDLEDHNDNYEIELEDNPDKNENDEFDNPDDSFENDFNETEDELDDIDDEDDEDDDADEYIEDDVQEEDPRKF